MEASAKRARIENYFAPFPSTAIIPLAVGFIICAGGIAAGSTQVFIAGLMVMFAGAIWVIQILRARPTNMQFDDWLAEDVDELFERARKRLDIKPEDVIAEPVVIGPGLLFMGWKDAVRMQSAHLPPNMWRAGEDGVLRVGAFTYQVLFPMEKYLASYICSYDLCEGEAYNEHTEEFFYRDIVSVSTRTDEMTVQQIMRKGLLRRTPEVITHTFNDFDTFRLTLSSGDAMQVVVKCSAPQKALLKRKASLPAGAYDDAVNAIRKLLRDKK
jgi:hypothetical protein